MVKKLVLVFLLALFIIPAVFSEDYMNTEINVKTDSGNKIFLAIKDATTQRIIGSYNRSLSDDGSLTVNFPSPPKMLSFSVDVYDGSSLIESRSFDEQHMSGTPILLDLTVEEVQENTTEENATEETTNETTEINESENAGITGGVVSETENKSGILRIIFFVVGGIIVASLIIFVAFTKFRGKIPGSYTVTKLSEKRKQEKEENKDVSFSEDNEIREAQEKLREMQEKIDKLSKIKEAERKFDDARRELENIRGS